MPSKPKVEIFHSFEDENRAEDLRRAQMTHEERMQELSILQARRWGSDWHTKPMVKKASWQWTDW